MSEITKSTKTVPIMQVVQTGTKEVPVWIYEGKEYTDEVQAQRQKQADDFHRIWDNVKHYALPYLDIPNIVECDWCYITTEEELECFKQRYGYSSTYAHVHIIAEPVVGDWACHQYIDGGDSRDEIRFCTWSYMRRHIIDMLNVLDNPADYKEAKKK